MTDVLYICLTLLVTVRLVMKCSVCGVCTGQGAGMAWFGGEERRSPSVTLDRSVAPSGVGHSGISIPALVTPQFGCLEELLSVLWLCFS